MTLRIIIVLFVLTAAAPAFADEHPALARARVLYNAGALDEAIAAASIARSDPASSAAAALVIGRSHLELFRRDGDVADLASAREALAAVNATALSPRDQVDLQVGLGQALFLSESFGAAAELFESALSGAAALPDRDRLLLLDWWATALDREAQRLDADRRPPIYHRIVERMEDEVRLDPGSAPGNYWLAAGLRGAGDPDRAWHAATAAWVRSRLRPDTADILRADLDRLVNDALAAERARSRPAAEQEGTAAALRAEWELLKAAWP